MKKLLMLTALTIATAFIATNITGDLAFAAKKEAKGKPQTICPVMGDKIDKKYYTDYKGYRIYFCCASCPDEFKKDPEKYMKKLKESGVTLEKTPKKGDMGNMKMGPEEHHHMN
jgi:YHS domain-containing protein